VGLYIFYSVIYCLNEKESETSIFVPDSIVQNSDFRLGSR
jgi:hypothetical protein